MIYNRWHHNYFETKPHPQFTQEMYVAGLLVTKMKIFANENGTHFQFAYQDFFDKFLRKYARELMCERHHDHGFQAKYAKPIHALCIG